MTLLLWVRLAHFLGFSAALGGALATRSLRRKAEGQPPSVRAALELGASTVVTGVELVGLFLALFAGIGLLVFRPELLDPKTSGVGIWLFLKLVLVALVVVFAHVKMFRAARLVRERASGASEADGLLLLNQVIRYERLGFLGYGLIFMLTVFRYAIFG